ncbi:hypothetical protein VNI00_004452 [Paramarasmius palmivorus]|uniref:FAD-binding domain-containing protein n=1 Tax=Paramarasmius palmivorus TaxID=297713 RepID=A0AAW0DF78_9AGAR
MDVPILIVGAGPSGLALALIFCRHGIPVRVIDKSNNQHIGSRACRLQPRTLELYKLLGILSTIEKRAVESSTSIQVYTSPEGFGPIQSFSLYEQLKPHPAYHRINGITLCQDDHQAILRDALQKDYALSVELGIELLSYEQSLEAVLVRLAHPNGNVEMAHFKWVIGADGAESIVREQLGLDLAGFSGLGNTYLVGDIEAEHSHCSTRWKVWGSYTYQALLLQPYTKSGKPYFHFMYGGCNVDISKLAMASQEELLEMMYNTIGRRSICFGQVVSSGIWSARNGMVNEMRHGRVFLVDAAHVHSPGGSLGINTGIQDSFNLAWKLSLVYKGLASPRPLLDSYSAERIPAIAASLGIVKNPTVSALSQNQRSRDWDLRQFDVNYRSSPIITDDLEPSESFQTTLHAGDRAPDATGLVITCSSQRTTLYDLLDAVSHTVIAFLPGDCLDYYSHITVALSRFPPVMAKTMVIHPQSTVWQHHDGVVFIDEDGYAFEHYESQPDEVKVVIIRPDGYIGAVITDVSGVEQYFAEVLNYQMAV